MPPPLTTAVSSTQLQLTVPFWFRRPFGPLMNEVLRGWNRFATLSPRFGPIEVGSTWHSASTLSIDEIYKTAEQVRAQAPHCTLQFPAPCLLAGQPVAVTQTEELVYRWAGDWAPQEIAGFQTDALRIQARVNEPDDLLSFKVSVEAIAKLQRKQHRIGLQVVVPRLDLAVRALDVARESGIAPDSLHLTLKSMCVPAQTSPVSFMTALNLVLPKVRYTDSKSRIGGVGFIASIAGTTASLVREGRWRQLPINASVDLGWPIPSNGFAAWMPERGFSPQECVFMGQVFNALDHLQREGRNASHASTKGLTLADTGDPIDGPFLLNDDIRGAPPEWKKFFSHISGGQIKASNESGFPVANCRRVIKSRSTSSGGLGR